MSWTRSLLVILAAISFSAVGLVLIASMDANPRVNWHPHYTSRSPTLRDFDGFAEHFAIYALCALLAALLGCYLWLMLLPSPTNNEQTGNQSRNSLQETVLRRFKTIGKLTSVAGSLSPFVLMQFILVVIAYHPSVSPTGMPTGLLVLLTLGFGAFLGTALFARWYFRNQREAELNRLRDRCLPVESIERLSEGVFKPFSESPFAWIAGGGASVALIDVWVRLWTLGL